MHSLPIRFIIHFPKVLFFITLVYAPFAYGTTRAWSIVGLNWLLGAVGVSWIFSLLVERRWPRIGFIPILLCFLILLIGWATTFTGWYFPRITFDWSNELVEELSRFASIDWKSSFSFMTTTSLLLVGFFFAMDLWNEPLWNKAFILVLSFTGFAMALFGILQRLVGGPFLLTSEDGSVFLSFATYRYHGNAAAFLNLVWPLLAASTLLSFLKRSHPFLSSTWLVSFLLTLMACFLNISKAGHLLSFIGIILFALFAGIYLWNHRSQYRLELSMAELAFLSIPLFIMLVSLFFLIPWNRWEALEYMGVGSRNPRIEAYRNFLPMIPEAGYFGFGPGTFAYAYQGYLDNSPAKNESWWLAHEDYIQTLVEWGWIAGALWFLLFAISTLQIALGIFFKKERSSSCDLEYSYSHYNTWTIQLPDPHHPLYFAAAFISVVSTALHAAIDFPMQVCSIQLYFLVWMAFGWARIYRIRK